MEPDLVGQPAARVCWAMLTSPANSTFLPSATVRACSTAALMPPVMNLYLTKGPLLDGARDAELSSSVYQTAVTIMCPECHYAPGKSSCKPSSVMDTAYV
jgi:hypothetical protein